MIALGMPCVQGAGQYIKTPPEAHCFRGHHHSPICRIYSTLPDRYRAFSTISPNATVPTVVALAICEARSTVTVRLPMVVLMAL